MIQRDVRIARPRRRRLTPAVAAALLIAAPAAPATRPAGAQLPAREAVPERESVSLAPVLGIHVGTPQKLSATLGMGRWRHRPEGDRTSIAFAAVEPGLRAGRFSVGYFRAHGNLLAGAAFRASALRTWRDPRPDVPNRTYVGLEASAHAVLSARLGLFHRTSAAPGRPLLVTFDVGVLF